MAYVAVKHVSVHFIPVADDDMWGLLHTMHNLGGGGG